MVIFYNFKENITKHINKTFLTEKKLLGKINDQIIFFLNLSEYCVKYNNEIPSI